MSKIQELFGKNLAVINDGIRIFYEDMKNQNVKVTHVDFKPPAGGNKKLASLLSKLS